MVSYQKLNKIKILIVNTKFLPKKHLLFVYYIVQWKKKGEEENERL